MNIGFVGMGNMGQMLAGGLVRSSAVAPEHVWISNRSLKPLLAAAERLPGVQVAYSNRDLARRSQIIFLCVKAGETKEALGDMAPCLSPEHVLVALTNTVEIGALEQAVSARVAKVIPSLVQNVEAGVSLVMFGGRCTVDDKAALLRLMGAFSTPCVIEERQARVASDLTSCGPAFLSHVYRAIARAARTYQPDLPGEVVDALIRQTAAATCTLMERMGYTFDDVIAKVSTPGGITADGIKILDQRMAGVWEEVIETTIVQEGRKKGKLDLG